MTKRLRIDGAITSNGMEAQSTTLGGGSGGSIRVVVHQVEGIGSIQVSQDMYPCVPGFGTSLALHDKTN